MPDPLVFVTLADPVTGIFARGTVVTYVGDGGISGVAFIRDPVAYGDPASLLSPVITGQNLATQVSNDVPHVSTAGGPPYWTSFTG